MNEALEKPAQIGPLGYLRTKHRGTDEKQRGQSQNAIIGYRNRRCSLPSWCPLAGVPSFNHIAAGRTGQEAVEKLANKSNSARVAERNTHVTRPQHALPA